MTREKVLTIRDDFGGLAWPNYDHKPEACYARVMSHLKDMDVALPFCRERRVCIQAGGHAGLWPGRLAEYFSRVYTFEAEPILFQCLCLNTAHRSNIYPYARALGEFPGTVKLRPHVSAGSWRVDPDGTHPVEQVTIDDVMERSSYPDHKNQVDAIFLDVEGYEAKVLRGAVKTIERCRPVVMVEELPRHADELRCTLKDLHYREVARVHSDHVWISRP